MSHYVHKVIISCRIMINVMETFAAALSKDCQNTLVNLVHTLHVFFLLTTW